MKRLITLRAWDEITSRFQQQQAASRRGFSRSNQEVILSRILTAIALLGSSLAQERQTMFNVGSYRLYMACEGASANSSANSSANAPTVLLVTGFGRGSDDLWGNVTPGVAKFARVCRYDRANIGKSDRANGAMTTARIVTDLERLLEVSGVRGPLVMVGQGFGSFTVRAFAAKHSASSKLGVAGAILIEPQPEAFGFKSLDVIPAKPSGEENAREMRPDFLVPRIADVSYAESAEQVAKSGNLGSLPLVVLVRGKPSSANDSKTDNYPDGMNAALEKSQRALQTGLAKLSSRGKAVSVKTAGPILEQAPEAVINAIRDVLESVRK